MPVGGDVAIRVDFGSGANCGDALICLSGGEDAVAFRYPLFSQVVKSFPVNRPCSVGDFCHPEGVALCVELYRDGGNLTKCVVNLLEHHNPQGVVDHLNRMAVDFSLGGLLAGCAALCAQDSESYKDSR